MKNFTFTLPVFLAAKQLRQLPAMLAVLLITSMLPAKLFAQKPIIGYSSPKVYFAGAAITAINPSTGGGPVSAPGYNSTAATFASGFSSSISGLAADAAGNIYVANQGNGGAIPPAVYKIPAGGGSPVSIGSGFSGAAGLAVDGAGNVYVADGLAGAVKRIAASDGSTTTVAAGFSNPGEIALDAAGNIYVADINNIKKIQASDKSVVTIGPGFTFPAGVAVDALGNVYVSDPSNQAVKEIPAGGGSVVTLASGSFFGPLTVDAAGNIYVVDGTNSVIVEIPAGGTIKTIAHVAAQDVALDGAGNLYFVNPLSNTVLELKPTGGYYISPFLPAGLSFNNATGAVSGTPTAASPATNYTVTAYNNAGSGHGTLNITVNPLTISYSSPQVYNAGTAITALTPVVNGTVAAPGYNSVEVTIATGVSLISGIASDAAGNIYLADEGNGGSNPAAVYKIPAGGGSKVSIGSGFVQPRAIAVDNASNVYVAEPNSVKKIAASDGSTTVVASGFNNPSGLATDAAGNVYVAGGIGGKVSEILAANGSVITISSAFSLPTGVAIDAAGNLYVIESRNSTVQEIQANGGGVITLGSGSLLIGLVLDAAGNVYTSDVANNAIDEIPAGGTIKQIANAGTGAFAFDGAGNLYFADASQNILELKPVGGYYMSPFLPAGLNFNSATGVISGTPTAAGGSAATNYTVTAYNSGGSTRATVNIGVNPVPPVISYSGPQVYPTGTAIAPLTPTVNGTVTPPGYNGTAVAFAGPFGAGGVTGVAADAAGNVYVSLYAGAIQMEVRKIPAGGGTSVSIGTGFTEPTGLAVDRAGNVYVADAAGGGAIKKIAASDGSTSIVASGFGISTIAVDASGNLYVADEGSNAVKEIRAADGSVVTIGSGFFQPLGIAVDAAGNVYVLDTNASANNSVKEIPAGGGAIITLASGAPFSSLALDAAGNIYVTETGNNLIDEIPAGGTIKPIANTRAQELAIDGAGNLYFVGLDNSRVSELKPTGGYYISPFLPAGLNFNSATGVISGTPTTVSPATSYTITAYNGASSGHATVNIAVNPAPPVISYSSPQTYTAGTAITALAPASTGVAAWGYGNPVIIGSGFSLPIDVAADATGNVYAVDVVNNNVTKIPAGGGPAVVFATGFNSPRGIACDAAGNVYVADSQNNVVKEITPGGTVSTIGPGFNSPQAVAVDGAGNVYVADSGTGSIKKILAGSNLTSTLKTGFVSIGGVAIDAAGNIYAADAGASSGALYKIPVGGGAMVAIGTGLSRPSGVATDAAGNVYVSDLNKSTAIVIAPDGSQVTIGTGFGLANGIAVDGAGNLYIADSANGAVKEMKIMGGYFLPAPLPARLTFDKSTGIISGTPSTTSPATNYTVIAYNSGGSGQATVNITVNVVAPAVSYSSPQVYNALTAITPLLPVNTGGAVAPFGYSTASPTLFNVVLRDAVSVVMDKSGNFYMGGVNGQVSVLQAGASTATIFATGLGTVFGIALDASNNVYAADGVHVWKIPAGGGTPATLGSFQSPFGVACDAAGNVYVADNSAAAGGVYKMAPDGTGQIKIDNNLQGAVAVAFDTNGNLFIGDQHSNALYEIPAGGTQTLLASGFAAPLTLTIDAMGHVFMSDFQATYCYSAGAGLLKIAPVITHGLVTDANGNLIFSDGGLFEISPNGGYFVSSTLPPGLSINPTSGAISGTPTAASPAKNYTVTAYNSAGNSQATVNITVNPLTISYSSPQVYTAGTAITALAPVVNGIVAPQGYNSTAVNFASFSLGLSGIATDAVGNVYAATTNGSQSAVYKIPAGGGSQVSIGTGFGRVNGVTVDHAGNVYVSDIATGSVKKIAASDGSTTTLASGFNNPGGLAVDAAGNIYVADQSNNAVKEIPAAGGSVITIGSGFSSPKGVAIDAAGNIYVADFGNKAVKEIPAGGGAIVTLASGFLATGLTVDAGGNIFVTDLTDLVIDEIPAGGTIKTIANLHALNVAVDGAGNLYTADAGAGNTTIITYKPTGGYYISQFLPAGLNFNGTTGVISGTPTAASPATNYTVTAYNSASSGQTTVNLTVNPLILSYSSPQVYTAGTPITALAPVVNGTVAAQGYNSAAVTVASGIGNPSGIAIDAAGNIYVTNLGGGGAGGVPAVYKIPATGGSLLSIGSGFFTPRNPAVDHAGNVYVFDSNSIKKIAANGGNTTIVASGFSDVGAVAVDGAGNIYVADTNNNIVKEILVGGSVITIGSGFHHPAGIAVDIIGNVYVADFDDNAVKEIPAGGGGVITLVQASGALFTGLTLDAAGNIYVADAAKDVIDEIPAGGTLKTIANVYSPFIALDGAGNLYFLDLFAGAVKEFKPTGGYYISQSLPVGLNFNSTTGVISGTPTTTSPATNYTVTAYNSVSSGQATVNIAVNPLTIAYTTPQVYTAGTAITALAPTVSGTVAAPGYRTPVSIGSGFNGPTGVAVDNAGNVYVGDYFNNAVKVIPFNGGSPQVIGSGFNNPDGIAIDAAGNIYVADKGNNAIKKMSNFGAGTITSIGSGFSQPTGVAVDALGNVFVADANNIKEIPAGGGAVLTLGSGFNAPAAVAVDAAGNIYVADYNNNAVKEIVAGSGTILTLGSGFSNPYGVAVDAAGNVYVGDRGNNAVKVIPYGTGSPVNIGTGFNQPTHLTVDASGNVYVGDYGNSLVKKVTPAGGYHLSSALPRGLIFDNTTGVISGTPSTTSPATNYTVTAYNSASSGAATVNITVNPLTVSYSSPQVYSAGTAVTALAPVVNGTVSPPGYNSATVTLASDFTGINWMAADAAGNVYVSNFDPGSEAGGVYKIPAGGGSEVSIGSGIGQPQAITVDRAGNVYVADNSGGTIKKIAASDGSTTNIKSGFLNADGLAVDAAGNIYVTDEHNQVEKIQAADGSVVLIGSGFNAPASVAVDAAGNIYVVDLGNNAVKEIPAGGGGIITLASGYEFDTLTLDAAGNVYVTAGRNNIIAEIPAGGTIKTIANIPEAWYIALDGAGNLYYVRGVNAVGEYKPAGGYYISPFLPAGLSFNSTTGVISGTPTTASPAANYTVTAYNSASSGQAAVNITVNPPTPAISPSGTLSALTTTYGTASSSASFNVSGANMTAGILVTPPTGFEVSTDNSVFSNTVTIGSAGTIASTPVYVRLAASAVAGNHSGNIVLSSAGATDVTFATVSSAVNGAPLTITASNVNKGYGSALTGSTGSAAYTVTSGNLKNGNTISSVTIAYGTGSAATDAVNTYTGSVIPSAAVGANGFLSSNYNITYAKGSIIVGQAALTITASNVNKTYGSTLTGASGSTAYSITSGSLKNGNTISSVTIAYGTGSAATDAVNTYTGSVTPSAAIGANGFLSSNYNITYAKGNIIVGQAVLTIAANNVNKTYGATLTGASGSTAYSITSGSLKNGNTISSITVSYSTGGAATDAVNTYTGSVTPSAAIGANGFVSSNYNITYAKGNIIVGQAVLTLTANNVNKTYGATLSGAAGSTAYAITSGSLKNGNTISSVTIAYGTGSAATDAVNTYTGSVTPSAAVGANGFLSSNYNITYAKGSIIIGQAVLTLTAHNVNKTYGATLSGAAGSTAYAITSGSLKNGNTIGSVTIAYGSGSAATDAVATYTGSVTPSAAIGANGFLSSNYAITYAKGNITIGKAALTITAGNINKTYGIAITGGSGSTAYSITGGTLKNGNTVNSVTIAYGAGSAATDAAGSYTGSAAPSAATGANGFLATNYNITYSPGNIIVGRAVLTITANNVNKTFGTTLIGAAGSTAYTITGGALQNSETVSSVTIAYGTGGSTFSAVGTYTGSVIPSAAIGAHGFSGSNYTITYARGDIIIGQAPLTITARNVSKTYGTAITGGSGSIAYSITGGTLKNGNTVNSVTIAYGTGSAATGAAGTYTGSVSPSGARGANGFLAGNYNITYTTGNIVVGKAALTITANNVNKPLGNTLTGGTGSTAFSITSGGLQNGETIGTVTIAYGAGASASAGLGTYTGSVIPSAASGSNGFLTSNYQITYAKGNIVVAKPVITATGTLTALSTMQGTPSVSSSFMVSGTSIAAGILVTAPTGFEVSTDNITFSSSLTIPGINTIPAGPVYVRLTAADAAGSYSGNVVLTGLNAVTVTVATMKSTVNPLLPLPGIQARLVTFSNTTANSTTVSWTNGSGAGRVVFMRLISSGSALPGNGTLYTANTIFGSGTEIGTTGWYCIYNGTGNTVNVTGLMQGTTYRVTVLEYNGTPGDAAYLEVNPPATAPNYLEARVSPANVTTTAIYPTIPARLVTFSNTTSTSTTASWANGDGTARAVFMELTGTGSVVLTDGTTYTPNTTFGVGSTVIMSGKPFYCIYNGTGNSVNISGLSPSTLYRVTVVEYKGSAGSEKYLNTGQSPGNVTTGAPPLNSLVLPKDNGEATPLVSSFSSEKIEANNILSPNGDGINDIWVVKNIAFYPNNTVTVYDRAGKIVFTRKGYSNDWDGTYRGSVVNEGTYYYLIDLGNGTTAKGFITVVKDR